MCAYLFMLCPGGLYASGWIAGYGSAPLLEASDIQSSATTCLAGYGLFCNRKASGIHDDVSIRSLYLADDDTGILFVSLDAIGFSQQLGHDLREQISKDTAVAPQNILIAATHTHSSIDLQGLWGGVEKQLKDLVIARAVRSARQAYDSRQKAQVKWSSAHYSKSWNRRYKNADVLPQITTLHVQDKDGQNIALLFSMGSHPVILDQSNQQVSADWIHYSRQMLEKKLKTDTLFINGTLGDVLPSMDSQPSHQRDFEAARKYGHEIAAQVIKGLNNTRELDSRLNYCTETLDITSDNTFLIFLTKLLQEDTVNWFSSMSAKLQTRTSVIKLGELVILTTPGEPITSLGKQLLSELPDSTAIFSLTHDSLGYLIPSTEFGMEGTYEKQMAVSKEFGDRVVKSLKRLHRQCATNH